MFDSIKKICAALALVALGSRAAFGFALGGPPNEPWQITTLAYQAPGGAPSSFFDIGGGVDIDAPKNFAQGYRWNVPDIVYAYDASFTSYFGAQGEAAVDAGFAMFNSLSNVSAYSTNLAEIPRSVTKINFNAQALGLYDIKSAVMQLVIEQLGLAQPRRWTYCLQDRFTGDNLVCGDYRYAVIMRNYDVISPSRTNGPYSEYVNGVLFDYTIVDQCSVANNVFAPIVADAVEVAPDPVNYTLNQAVAEQYLAIGEYYTGFTRDDLMGLRYLYASNNVVTETTDPSSLLYYPNTNALTTLTSSNYGLFLQQARTNGPAALLALYPNLIITSSNSYFGPLVTTNVTYTVGRPPNGYAGEEATIATTTYTTNYQNLYNYTFGNLIVLHSTPTTYQVTQTQDYGPVVNGYAGEYAYTSNNAVASLALTNGDFYIVPPGLCGQGYIFLTNSYPAIPSLVAVTNVATVSTNGLVTTQGNTYLIAQQTITYYTNYEYVVEPIQCESSVTELRQGVEKINFVRQDFDSVIGQAWGPVTNIYNLVAITNSHAVVETLQRVLYQPDILISAANLGGGPDTPLIGPANTRTTPRFTQTTNVGEFGPGTINPYTSTAYTTNGIQFVFNNVGPQYFNSANGFLNFSGEIVQSGDGTNAAGFTWASFDGSTNAPTLYPNTVSLSQLEAQIYFQITTSLLPNVSVSTNKASSPYSYQLQAQSSVSPPFYWTYATNSTLLPGGLSLSTNGVISGVPTAAQGTYDFAVQAQDSTGRVTGKSLFIVIGP